MRTLHMYRAYTLRPLLLMEVMRNPKRWFWLFKWFGLCECESLFFLLCCGHHHCIPGILSRCGYCSWNITMRRGTGRVPRRWYTDPLFTWISAASHVAEADFFVEVVGCWRLVVVGCWVPMGHCRCFPLAGCRCGPLLLLDELYLDLRWSPLGPPPRALVPLTCYCSLVSQCQSQSHCQFSVGLFLMSLAASSISVHPWWSFYPYAHQLSGDLLPTRSSTALDHRVDPILSVSVTVMPCRLLSSCAVARIVVGLCTVSASVWSVCLNTKNQLSKFQGKWSNWWPQDEIDLVLGA